MLHEHFTKVLFIFFVIVSTGASTTGTIECLPPTSGVTPLSYSGCRLAITEFSIRHPGDEYEQYILTRRMRPGSDHIQCPYVIEDEGCVFTLDFYNAYGSFAILAMDPISFLEAALSLVRRCVRREGVDGGRISWKGYGWKIRFTLAHTAMPFSIPDPGPYTNMSSVGDGNKTFVARQRLGKDLD
ncbi:hypothetical protein N7G274_007108 [Stereocaulon virgatum]|uniref:Uncharacterized protein n=1 Tax=Stereocaulon virgatum TaxID=373712 RepID=A0ABR4A2W5_9LECA